MLSLLLTRSRREPQRRSSQRLLRLAGTRSDSLILVRSNRFYLPSSTSKCTASDNTTRSPYMEKTLKSLVQQYSNRAYTCAYYSKRETVHIITQLVKDVVTVVV